MPPCSGSLLPSIAAAPWLTRAATQRVFSAIEAGGYDARAVGGAVRNALMAMAEGNAPPDESATDIDIATSATPEETMRLAAAAGLRIEPTGLAHGTVMVIADDLPIEVTTLRRDIATYGRHADVAFTTDWAADAARRDFTMNAIYADRSGAIFDPLGGYADLIARRVRFIGDPVQRIREDYLRILRFFRFFASYGVGPPDPDALAACTREHVGLRKLSRERVQQEMKKLILAPRAADAARSMADNGLLPEVLRSAPRLTAFERYCRIEDAIGDACPMGRLASLAVAVEEDAERLGRNFRLSRREISLLNRLGRALSTGELQQPSVAQARRLLYSAGPENYRTMIKFGWALDGAPHDDPGWLNLFQLPQHWQCPGFPLSGRDLLALGLSPGAEVGALLAALEESWIASGFLASKADLLREAVLQISARNARSST